MGFVRKSCLSQSKQDHLTEHFVAGTTARTAAALFGVNRKTAAYFYHRLREIIAYEMAAEAEEVFGGEIEVDESYFGGRRKGKRGRGSAGKIPVFGLLKRGGRVYTKIMPDASSDTLVPIIERKVVPDSIVYTDCWKRYNQMALPSPSIMSIATMGEAAMEGAECAASAGRCLHRASTNRATRNLPIRTSAQRGPGKR